MPSKKKDFISIIKQEIKRLETKFSGFSMFAANPLNQSKIKILQELMVYMNEQLFNPQENIEQDFFNQPAKEQLTPGEFQTNADILKAHAHPVWDKLQELIYAKEVEPRSAQIIKIFSKN